MSIQKKSKNIVIPVESYSYEQMIYDLNALAAAYPESLVIHSLGKSEMSKNIPVGIIGSLNADFHILVQGAIHGREHMTSTLILSQMEYVLTGRNAYISAFGRDYVIEDAVNNVCFHCIPMMNPDGVEISQSRKLPQALYPIYKRDMIGKKADSAGGLSTDISNLSTGLYDDISIEEYASRWKANAKGVDLNRNFDADWESCTGTAEPSSEKYKGKAPGDQSETKALIDYTLSRHFNATISYHSSGSVIYYEFGKKQPANRLSKSLAEAVKKVTGYALEGSEGVDGGGYKDWAIQALCIPSITIEIGDCPSPLRIEEFPSIFERNKDVLPVAAVWVKKNICPQ
ncbi:MAG: M14 family zinc carboxypeptidase [Caldicoprobacterales bacterium]|jgi:g-D-glutamyl-meso-diaminopimelate peptidase